MGVVINLKFIYLFNSLKIMYSFSIMNFTDTNSVFSTVRDNGTRYEARKKTKEEIEDTSAFQFIRPESFSRIESKPPAANVVFIREEEEDKAPEEKAAIPEEPVPGTELSYVRVIGELFKTYVLFESGDTFYLLDKHAAHERIIFERLKNCVTTKERQVLLKPVVVSVSSEEYDILFSRQDILMEMGFSFEDFGNHEVLLREVPLILAEYDVADIFLDVCHKLLENRRFINSDRFEDLLHSIACRSAIKANDKNSLEELTELLRQVYRNDEIRHCPHGRPVAIALTKTDLEKRFGRIQG